jgi:hypothetical protein
MEIPDRPLDPAYRIVPAGGTTGPTVDDVLRFWHEERAVPEAEAQRRVHEVLLVATHGEGGPVAGVSTAALHRSPQLRADVWYFRTFVGTAHRKTNVAVQLLLHGHDALEDRFTSGVDTRAIGTLIDVQHEGLKRGQPHGVWPQSGFTFIGENQRGDHVRVRYYPGALAPPPPT